MLCPAIKDPFDGQWYRTFAAIHQGLLCPLLSKLFCIISSFFLTKFGPTKVKQTLDTDISIIKWKKGDQFVDVKNGVEKNHVE